MVRWMISMGLEDLCLEWDGWMDGLGLEGGYFGRI